MLKFMAHFKVDSHGQVGRSGVVEGKRVAATREKMPEQLAGRGPMLRTAKTSP